MNTFKSTLLLVSLMLVLLFLGEWIGGQNGMILAFVISVAMNFTAYFYSDKIALAMYSAQPVTREQLPRAYDVVERLAAKDGIPMPKIYVIPTESPNAFATGRNPQHASVAVTHGILGLLTDEFDSHIKTIAQLELLSQGRRERDSGTPESIAKGLRMTVGKGPDQQIGAGRWPQCPNSGAAGDGKEDQDEDRFAKGELHWD